MMDLELYTSEYTVATAGEQVIPINIAAFDSAQDFLLVYVNHVYVSEEDYSLNAAKTQVVFTDGLEVGDLVEMLIFKTKGVEIDVSEFGLPQSRNEAILQNILGGTNSLLTPESRIEVLLMALLKNSNVDASDNVNVMAALTAVKEGWANFDTGISDRKSVV